MPAAYELPNTLNFATANLADVWLGGDYPTGANSYKFTIAALKADIVSAVSGTTDLTATHLSGTVTVNSSTGTDATLLPATSGAAGLMIPAQFSKLAFITCTQAINLDTLATSNHAAATAADASMVVNPSTQAIRANVAVISGVINRLQLTSQGLYVPNTDLSVTYSLSTVNIISSTGLPVSISEATPSQAGIMGNSQAAKLANLTLTTPVNLDTLSTQIHQPATALNTSIGVTNSQQISVNLGAVSGVTNQVSIQGGGIFVPPTNITASIASTTITINSSTGSGVLVTAATTSNAGVMTAADKTKLNLITATASINLDTLSSQSHTAASAGNASILVSSQAISVRISATAGNQLTLNGDGLFVASSGGGGNYAIVADMATLNAIVSPATGSRRRVTSNRLTFTYTGSAWEPDCMRIRVTSSQFSALTDPQLGQEVVITDTDVTQLNTASGWVTTNIGMGVVLIPSASIVQGNIDSASIQLVGANVAQRVMVQIENAWLNVWISTDGSAPGTADAIFTPSTGVLSWSGRAYASIIALGDRVSGVYKPV